MSSQTPDILLVTLNAKYAHASFGLRYLLANMGNLAPRTTIAEFDINQRPIDILESILARNPTIVGLGVYIWNVDETTHLAADLKRLRPDITLILGGPEISYETEQQEITRHADYIITGEADLAFAELCEKLLAGRRPLMKIIPAELPEFQPQTSDIKLQIASTSECESKIENRKSKIISLPYHHYTAEDIAHRVVYVEASRGCPFECEFCLSSLDVPVRNAPLDTFLAAMQSLLDRGLRQFKFVDRTFNLNLKFSRGILEFFLERYTPGLFLHFEMIPDRLPDALREVIARFPAGALQFEVGIQTFNEEVSERISRRQDNTKVEDNLRFLKQHTGVHIHADLIVGLPGEDLPSFAAGFDRLVALAPQEIQVGILKRLRGTPIIRHDAEWGMVYSPHAPYEVLETRTMDFQTIQRLRRFARYWDLIANSGNFIHTAPLIWQDGSPFAGFSAFSEWLFNSTHQTHAIALNRLAELLFNYLTTLAARNPSQVAAAMSKDFSRAGRRDVPDFLRPHLVADSPTPRRRTLTAARQARHLK